MYSHASELALREGGKWEPVLSNRQMCKGDRLQEPCFDIYYHHRVGGMPPDEQPVLPYALVVSLRAPGVSDFYNSVVRTYQQVLEPLRPSVQVPIRL